MKKVAYLVGIKGVGMTALAVYLKQSGYKVLGSDVSEKFPTDKILKNNKIHVKKGFFKKNINKTYDFVITTGAHSGMKNLEVMRAKELKIPVYSHGQFIGKLMKGKTGISVAGTHGKTTTSSMIAFLLEKSGLKPSFLIGAPEINGLGPAGRSGAGKYIVLEADEYITCPKTDKKPRFLWQSPKILVFTSIDFDHPDAYQDIEETKQAFLDFSKRLPEDGLLVVCRDDENIVDLLAEIDKKVITYGYSPKADYQISKYYSGKEVSFFRLSCNNLEFGEFMLKVSGRHNTLNAVAGAIVANYLGINWDNIKKNIKLYTGAKRRLEKIAFKKGVLLYDDYAHHPSEIIATLEGLKNWFVDRRIIVIFQPHTYSRTKALFSSFANAFRKADVVVLADIFASAREKKDPSVSAKDLVLAINKNGQKAIYTKDEKATVDYLADIVKKDDLIITMGAGDVYLWHKELLKMLDRD